MKKLSEGMSLLKRWIHFLEEKLVLRIIHMIRTFLMILESRFMVLYKLIDFLLYARKSYDILILVSVSQIDGGGYDAGEYAGSENQPVQTCRDAGKR